LQSSCPPQNWQLQLSLCHTCSALGTGRAPASKGPGSRQQAGG
jgi:hypothetical protein